MTHKELKKLLEVPGYPVAYYAFKKSKTPPFLAFVREDNESIPADDSVYASWHNYRVELYTDEKNPDVEEVFENLFKENDIYYDVEETYVESERLHLVIFRIQI